METLDYKLLNSNVKNVISKSGDKCVLELLDTIVSKSIYSSDPQVLETLNNISANTDGYVSEYFIDVGIELIYKDFYDFFMFIYNHKNSALENVFISAASMEMSNLDDSKNDKSKLEAFLNSQKGKYTFTKDQLDYFNKLCNKSDPTMFE